MSRKAEFKVEGAKVIGLMDIVYFYEFEMTKFDEYFHDKTPGYESYNHHSDHVDNKSNEVAFELIY